MCVCVECWLQSFLGSVNWEVLKQVKLLAKSGVFSRDGNWTEHTKVEPHSNVIPNWTNWKSLTTEPEPNRTIRLRHRTRTLHSVFDSHSQYDQRGANCYVSREWVVYWCDWFALNSLVWRLCCFFIGRHICTLRQYSINSFSRLYGITWYCSDCLSNWTDASIGWKFVRTKVTVYYL